MNALRSREAGRELDKYSKLIAIQGPSLARGRERRELQDAERDYANKARYLDEEGHDGHAYTDALDMTRKMSRSEYERLKSQRHHDARSRANERTFSKKTQRAAKKADSARSGGGRYGKAMLHADEEVEQEIESNLDQISGILGQLRMQGADMMHEMNHQNDLIGRMKETSIRTADSLKSTKDALRKHA